LVEVVFLGAVRHVRGQADLLVSVAPVEAGGLERHGGDDDSIASAALNLVLGCGQEAGAEALAALLRFQPQ
jgi:hypothetical protein